MISKGNSIYRKASQLSYSRVVRALGIVIAVTTVMLPGGAFGQNGNPNPPFTRLTRNLMAKAMANGRQSGGNGHCGCRPR